MFSEKIKVALSAENAQLLSGIDASRKAVESFRDRVIGVGSTLAGAFAGQQVIAGFKNLVNRLNALDDLSQKIQLPIEDLQVLGQVASLGGTDVETLGKAMVKLRLAGEQAAGGSDEMRKALQALGIDAKRFAEIDTVSQLRELSRGFNGASDEGAAFASIMKILGKNGAELIPTLKAGEAAIDGVARKLRIMSAGDVEAVARMSDEIELLSENIKNDLSRALVDVAPLLTRMAKLLADAGEGFAILTNPAGGTGMQGGELGGVDILRQMDLLEERKRKIDAMASGGKTKALGSEIGKSGMGGWVRKSLSSHGADADAELAALQARYKSLSREARAFAEQNFAFERMRKAGMGDDAMRKEMAGWYARTEAIRASVKAEHEMAAATAATGPTIEKQAADAKKLADELAATKSRVSARLVAGSDAETRKAYAQGQLADVLKGAGVGSADELRRKAGGDNTGESMRALDKVLDLMDMIKTASDEIGTTAAGRWNAWQDAVAASADELRRNKDEIDRINATIAGAAATANQQAAAKEALAVELIALRMTRDGQKEKADALVAEIAMRRDAADLAERTGLSEEKALAALREKARLERSIAGGGGAVEGGGGAGRPKRHQLGFGPSRLNGREGFLGGSASLRNSEIERRTRANHKLSLMGKPESAARFWERQLDLQQKLVSHLGKLGLA